MKTSDDGANSQWQKESQEFQCFQEFQEFQSLQNTGQMEIPSKLYTQVEEKIRSLLNPSPGKVFAKLAAIHLVIGSTTLLLCHQFEIQFFGKGMAMAKIWESEAICQIFCGSLFMGFSILVASLLLLPEEVRVLRRLRFPQFTILILLSMGILFCSGGTSIVTSLGLVWIVSSFLAALSSLEIAIRIRSLGVSRR